MLRRARAADDREVRRGGRASGRDRWRKAEGEGVLTTIATVGSDGRLVRRVARRRPKAPPMRRAADGSVRERFGEEPTRVLSVRRRPCRPRAHRGAGAAAVRRDLDRYAAGRDPGRSSRSTSPPSRRAIRSNCSARAPDGAFVAVMTHSHALDLDLVIAALSADRFAYVGLIGSDTKRARFTSAMRKMGMADATRRPARLPDRPDRRSRTRRRPRSRPRSPRRC